MILSGLGIKRAVNEGEIVITPFNYDQVNPNSYDVRLAPLLKVYTNHTLLSTGENPTRDVELGNKPYLLHPGTIYLGSTIEWTDTPAPWVPVLHGKSSRGRLGLCVHATAGFGDVGFKGTWTLELYCIQPVFITAGMKIAQIVYTRLEHPSEEPPETYNGRFHSATGPVAFIPDKN